MTSESILGQYLICLFICVAKITVDISISISKWYDSAHNYAIHK